MTFCRHSLFAAAAVSRLIAAPSLAHAAAPAPAAAAPAAPAASADAKQAQPAPNPNYSVNQAVGDWVVRCVAATVKTPTPCEMLQVRANEQTKQRVSSISFAYVPGRDSYALQIVVPTGVQLSKGLALAAGDHSLQGIHYNRCERDGCYVELLTDQATMNAIAAVGKQTSISVTGYGQSKEVQIPVSLTGFPEALDRMKSYAQDKASPPAAAPAAKAPARPAGR
jgi:invasion protein IalB